MRNAESQPTARHGKTILIFLATVWVLAFAEELLWDRFVWHERSWLFGLGWRAESWKWLIVPLLALPQMTHYILDGFIWKRKANPEFTLVSSPPPTPPRNGEGSKPNAFRPSQLRGGVGGGENSIVS
jgi:hypothetical protein